MRRSSIRHGNEPFRSIVRSSFRRPPKAVDSQIGGCCRWLRSVESVSQNPVLTCEVLPGVLSYSSFAMTTTRRDFVRLAGTGMAAALLSSPVFGANAPALGLIFPPKDYPIPPDAKRLYPSGVEFLGDGVGLPGGMTIQGYEEAIPRVVPVAEALAKRGAKVISVFGSSLTFYKGRQFHEELMQRVTKATGVTATTQSNGLLDGLRTAGAKRVALATAYTDEVTGRLKVFLEEYGFEVTS